MMGMSVCLLLARLEEEGVVVGGAGRLAASATDATDRRFES